LSNSITPADHHVCYTCCAGIAIFTKGR